MKLILKVLIIVYKLKFQQFRFFHLKYSSDFDYVPNRNHVPTSMQPGLSVTLIREEIKPYKKYKATCVL